MPVGSANQTLRNDAGNWVVSNSVTNDELNNFLITGITLKTTMDAEINGLLVGKGAGQKTENTVLGINSMISNIGGARNTALGYESLKNNTTGTDNTASGAYALRNNQKGQFNTATGAYGLILNTDGWGNTAVGHNSLSNNTVGNNNTAIGTDADVQNSNLTNSTAIGYQAEVNTSNTIKLGNTFVTKVITFGGIEAGGTVKAGSVTYPNTDGTTNQVLTTDGAGTLSWKTGIAAIAGAANSTLRHNGVTWISDINVLNDGTTLSTTSDAQINGITVGTGNNNVFANTAIGFRALNQCQSAGQQNTAIGRSALMMNTTGRENTATGKESLGSNTVGKHNTALGAQSLFMNKDGESNTAAGNMALRANTTGIENTALGRYAGWTGDFNNTTTIGYNAVRTADNQVRIGNINVTSIGGFVGWSTLSDARFKKNIEEKVIGLDFIMALRPVTYNIDIKSIENFRETPSQLRSGESERKAEEILQTGFIAQEVELAANKLGYDFSGVDAPQNDKDNYSLRYSEFVVPLVKAMQEQQELILKLQERISVLEKK